MEIRRALVRSRNDIVVESIQLPQDHPKPDEVLLKTRASFISAGTELAIYTGLDWRVDFPGNWSTYPFVPGYANVAEVVEVGAEVKGVQVGQRAFTTHRHVSQHFCAPGRELFVPIPDGVGDDTAAAARMAMVSVTAIEVADQELNDWVAVLGLGLVGNLCAQFFQLRGARVIGVDPFEPRRALAQKMGVEHVVGGSAEEVEAEVKRLTGGAGARITVDAVGDSRVIQQAVPLTADHGDVILLGTPRAPVEGDLTKVLEVSHYRWVNIKGALEWRWPELPVPHVRNSIQNHMVTALDLVQRGKLHVTELISHRIPATHIRDGYEGLLRHKETYWGVVLDWTTI